jgi:glycosyltransferase involved in cell wall biosynthesis
VRRQEITPNSAAPRVLFVGRMYAGHRVRFLNLQAHTRDDVRIRPSYRHVTGWLDGGRIERLPGLPKSAKGRARAVMEASAVATLPRPDVIWTGITEAAMPHLWAELGPLRRPLILDLDWTLEQQEQLAPVYFRRPPKQGVRYSLARLIERAFWSRVTLFTPWTTWAADSLRRQGVPDSRMHVLPPGVDLDVWQASRKLPDQPAEKLRLLFVGGDFERKGGQMLLDVFRSRFSDRCELDIVTPGAVEPGAGVRVHRAGPSSDVLQQLYRRADLFVMPTRAECFGIATVEAMASGLPTIVGDVGGARDIVQDTVTGWLVEPNAPALSRALDHALENRDLLPAMGRRARQVAEQRFDGRRNDHILVDLLIQEAERAQAAVRAARRPAEPSSAAYRPAPDA